jgi:hypothetical protein
LNALHPLFAPANVQTAGDNLIINEPKDHGELKILCETPVQADDLMRHIQFIEEGWELNGDHERLDTEQDESNIFEMPTSFVAEEFFTKGNDWSAACQSFLINKHNDRNGLKGIVF